MFKAMLFVVGIVAATATLAHYGIYADAIGAIVGLLAGAAMAVDQMLQEMAY